MGAALVHELVTYRPRTKLRPEWALLLDLAADADDVTRLTAPGFQYMQDRSPVSRRTLYYWLRKLREAGMVRVVSHSRSGGRSGGKGWRAVYEIQVPAGLTAQIAGHLESDTPRAGCNEDVPDISTGTTGQLPATGIRCKEKAPGSADSAAAWYDERHQDSPRPVTGETPPVIQVQPLSAPPLYTPVSGTSVEGAQTRSGQNLFIDNEDQDPEHTRAVTEYPEQSPPLGDIPATTQPSPVTHGPSGQDNRGFPGRLAKVEGGQPPAGLPVPGSRHSQLTAVPGCGPRRPRNTWVQLPLMFTVSPQPTRVIRNQRGARRCVHHECDSRRVL